MVRLPAVSAELGGTSVSREKGSWTGYGKAGGGTGRAIAGRGTGHGNAGGGTGRAIAGTGIDHGEAGGGTGRAIVGEDIDHGKANGGTGRATAGRGTGHGKAGGGTGRAIAGAGNDHGKAGGGTGRAIAGTGIDHGKAGGGTGRAIVGEGIDHGKAGGGTGRAIAGTGIGHGKAGGGTGDAIVAQGNSSGEAIAGRGYAIDGDSAGNADIGEGDEGPGAFVRLHLPATLNFLSSQSVSVSVFIDTGSDVCLVKRGLTPVSDLRPARQPMRLTGANKGAIAGGQLQVVANLRFEGDNPTTGKRFGITAPTILLEADIDEDVILSLEWLGERHFDVLAREHGLMAHINDRQLWLPGNQHDLRMGEMQSGGQVKAVPATPVRRALDLFCGRKSAARALQKVGFRVITLDSDPARDPDICCDIMEWDYKATYPPEYFDLVVACPPCTEYSFALTSRPREMDKADLIVKKTLEIIAYLAPPRWWLETPETGRLARRDFMQGYPYLDCDHCQFELLGYQKPTRFFGSKHLLDLAPVRCDGRTCPALVDVGHDDPKKRRGHKAPMGGHHGCVKKEVAYHIPEKLVLYASGLIPYEGYSAEFFPGLNGPPPLSPDPPPENAETPPFNGAEKKMRVPLSEEYRLRTHLVEEVLSATGVQPDLDGFSAEYNKNFPKWWGPGSPDGEDSMVKFWGESTLWLNPPYTMMEHVVQKLRCDHAHAIVVVPCWPTEGWYSALLEMQVWQWILPKRSRAFELRGKPSGPTKWPVGIFVVCGAPQKCSLEAIQAGKVHGKSVMRANSIDGLMAQGAFIHEGLSEMVETVRNMQLQAMPQVSFLDSESTEEDEEILIEIAQRLLKAECRIAAVKASEAKEPSPTAGLERNLREALIAEFGDSSLSGKYLPDPPVRGPFGEGEIWLKEDAKPVSVPPFHLNGERREALDQLVGKCIDLHKLEPGKGAWNTPAFPVPKKTPGTYRLVQDLRPQNAATIKDGHPLPRINDMVQRQGKNCIWSVLDLVDGFHQMPLRPDHRPITCMSTPRGSMQWTVQVMGLKNAATQFQRMMEWVLRDLPDTDPYIDDSITGSTGLDRVDRVWTNYHAVRAQLLTYKEQKMVCSIEKSELFQDEVEFCGHILREGRRSPAPGKLMPIQLWELPQTVTELRGFLGLTNYFSEYVEHYAETAAPLMGKLQLSRQDGKKGSKVRLIWSDHEIQAFNQLKEKLCQGLELWQPNLDMPFRLHCDASDFAIGAELAQEIEGEWRPVAFYSRKLAKSQKNWTPREKETYAIVASLRKWSGLIGFQPVLITTDHRSLEDWVTEHVDTPSGPRGRRARWHETLSQFDLQVKYIPGPDNIVPDAMSRWAYPASSSREDVSFHGSVEAKEEVKRMAQEEMFQANLVGIIRLGPGRAAEMLIGGELSSEAPVRANVHVVTRSELDTNDDNDLAKKSDSGSGGDGEGPPPPRNHGPVRLVGEGFCLPPLLLLLMPLCLRLLRDAFEAGVECGRQQGREEERRRLREQARQQLSPELRRRPRCVPRLLLWLRDVLLLLSPGVRG